jgi:ubiquitin carboxyl-terminal hydrolase 48
MLMVLSVCCLYVSDEISEQKADMLQVEEGFRGTLLTSGVSVQFCQDITFSE